MRGLDAEGDGADDADGDGLAVEAAGTPFGHLAEDADGFAVELGVGPFEDLDVPYLTVAADDEAAGDPPLDAFLVGLGGIDATVVDVGHQLGVSSGKGGLLGDVVVFKHFYVVLTSVTTYSGADPAGLAVAGYDGEYPAGHDRRYEFFLHLFQMLSLWCFLLQFS